MIETTDTLFKDYLTEDIPDEMISPALEINPNWKDLLSNICNIGIKGLVSRQNDLNWYLSENGVTYNVYDNPLGLNRPWNLNVIPLIFQESEWITIEKGIRQRTEILNFIIKDIYGKRELIHNGILPQEIIFGHYGFLQQCDKIKYNTNKHLLIHAIDMARGSDGQMWIINDHTQAPSGMGYALENRLTIGRVLPDLFQNIYVKKLSEFFRHFNELLMNACPDKNDNPNIVILTPGPHNETYFEHAYLSSFLGYSLVQGNDLIVRDGYLWMKSLKGLKKVDAVLRRVDDNFTDPLELREDSQLGVAGLLEVVRKQNVSVINPIGSRILENPGLIPFIPGVAKYFLNEDLILPQIATWWCGQEKEKKYVLEHLPDLIVKKIDPSNSDSIFFGETMSSIELNKLKQEISDRPYRFVGQSKLTLSTSPTLINQQLEPRRSVWRTYSIANDEGYYVMPGGLVRVAAEKGGIVVSNQKGGTSKDIWITTNAEEKSQIQVTRRPKLNAHISGLDNLPSQTAENLYWTGRYVSRTLVTTRFIRMVLKQLTLIQSNERMPNSQSIRLLCKAVTHLTATYPGFIDIQYDEINKNIISELLSVILDKDRNGSLSSTFSMLTNSYYSIRNLWSGDMWRVFDRIEKIWKDLHDDPEINIKKIIQALDQLITRLIAFMGLVEESILIEQGLLLYYIGHQLEQSMLSISKCRSLLVVKQNDQVEYEILESIVTSQESLNIYRYSYKTYFTIENVLDLILLDLKYPRSLAYQLNRLNKDLSILPQSKVSHEITNYEKYVFAAYSKVRLATSAELVSTNYDSLIRFNLDNLLSDLSNLLVNTSGTIINTYFNHTFVQNQLINSNYTI